MLVELEPMPRMVICAPEPFEVRATKSCGVMPAIFSRLVASNWLMRSRESAVAWIGASCSDSSRLRAVMMISSRPLSCWGCAAGAAALGAVSCANAPEPRSSAAAVASARVLECSFMTVLPE